MLVKHTYRCPRAGCQNPEMWSYSPEGLDTRIILHEQVHQVETMRNIRQFDEAAKKQPIKNYNTLEVTWQDVVFLHSRGIAIDEDIIWDGYSRKHQV